MKSMTITETGKIELRPLVQDSYYKKPSRSQVIAMNRKKEKVLSELRTFLDMKLPTEPFTFNLCGCEYKVNSGNFNAIEFYTKISKLPSERFWS